MRTKRNEKAHRPFCPGIHRNACFQSGRSQHGQHLYRHEEIYNKLIKNTNPSVVDETTWDYLLNLLGSMKVSGC